MLINAEFINKNQPNASVGAYPREIAFKHRPATCAGVYRYFGALFVMIFKAQGAEIFQHRSQACAGQVRILLKAISVAAYPNRFLAAAKPVVVILKAHPDIFSIKFAQPNGCIYI